jgi:DNA-binding TFAR19-related protein (PDSD5 family)
MSDDDELEAIKRKKMAQLMAMKKQQELAKDVVGEANRKKDAILKTVLKADAWAYLQQLRQANPALAQQIVGEFISPQVEQKMDLLLSLLAQGRIRTNFIPIDEIQYLERQFLGIKSKIVVKKRGEKEAVDLSKFLK